MKISNLFKLIISLIIPQLAGALGSIFTYPNIGGWYSTLNRPELAPPNWIFGPVWTTLFILMGLALYFVWRNGTEKIESKVAIGIFCVQLVLNIFWSIIFFGFQNLGLAFFEVLILWVAILSNIIAFSKVSKISACLLVPYLLWVAFAAYLNYMYWILN